MADEKKSVFKHRITIDQRERAAVTGILDVISFDEETVIGETDLGVVIIRGSDLHVNKLNLDNGELDVDGEITSVAYEDQSPGGKGRPSFLGKIFK